MNFGEDGSYKPTNANGEEVDVPTYWVTSAYEEDEFDDRYDDDFSLFGDYGDYGYYGDEFDYYDDRDRYDYYDDGYRDDK